MVDHRCHIYDRTLFSIICKDLCQVLRRCLNMVFVGKMSSFILIICEMGAVNVLSCVTSIKENPKICLYTLFSVLVQWWNVFLIILRELLQFFPTNLLDNYCTVTLQIKVLLGKHLLYTPIYVLD